MSRLHKAIGLGVVLLLLGVFGPVAAMAQDAGPVAAAAPTVDTGDTAWMLASAGLVLLMTPGLAFFYGGLVRRKNVLSVLMQCFMAMCLVTLQWVVLGYTLSFGPDLGGIIGTMKWALLSTVGADPNPDYAATIPHSAFMAFQLKFAIITPALIIGALAERIRFSAFFLFTILWSTLVYDPVAHWVWGVGGFLRNMGALDFAGGTVVHINAGMAALAGALVLGKRVGSVSPPHSLPLAILGAGMLWFGWFGFNAGSALGANGLAANAFVTTHVATAAAGMTWAICDWLYHKRPTTLGMITGAVAGLVSITPACGFVTPISAIWIGGIASIICFVFVTFVKPALGYDDTLDAFGVHGIGGIWGALATGLWATKAINAAGADGLFYGNPGQFIIQLKATVISMVFSFVASFILFKLVDMTIGLRIDSDSERQGLDQISHGESAYHG